MGKTATLTNALDEAAQCHYGDQLYDAHRAGYMIDPLTEHSPNITIDDAYKISMQFLSNRLADGEHIIGKKIGVTSQAVQEMLGVNQPDFGFLTNVMLFPDGAKIEIKNQLIQPRAEGEIAFFLRKDLDVSNITAADVLAATDYIQPCFEIVDSRIRDWKIKIQDTIADNASCGLFVLGEQSYDPRKIDLKTCRLRMEKNDREVSRGVGAATLGSPLQAIAWLANQLGRYGHRLQAGDIILSGALVPLEPVQAGDNLKIHLENIGTAEVRFV